MTALDAIKLELRHLRVDIRATKSDLDMAIVAKSMTAISHGRKEHNRLRELERGLLQRKAALEAEASKSSGTSDQQLHHFIESTIPKLCRYDPATAERIRAKINDELGGPRLVLVHDASEGQA